MIRGAPVGGGPPAYHRSIRLPMTVAGWLSLQNPNE